MGIPGWVCISVVDLLSSFSYAREEKKGVGGKNEEESITAAIRYAQFKAVAKREGSMTWSI